MKYSILSGSILIGIFLLVSINCLNNVSAVSLNNTVLNTTSSNSSITFDVLILADLVDVQSTYINLTNVTCPTGIIYNNYKWMTLNKDLLASSMCTQLAYVYVEHGGGGGALVNVTCNSPGKWSICINGTQTRTAYNFSVDAGFTCVKVTETQTCSEVLGEISDTIRERINDRTGWELTEKDMNLIYLFLALILLILIIIVIYEIIK